MYKKILSILLAFIIFLSLPIFVSASDSEHGGTSGSIEEEYPYIPLTDEINDEFYVFFNYLGAFLSPGVSPRDVLKQYCINQDGYTSDYFRWNDETKQVEVRSNFLHDSNDGITLPSEKAQILKQIIQEYPQTKANDSSYLEYTPLEQNGQIFYPRVYAISDYLTNDSSSCYIYYSWNKSSYGINISSVSIDTSKYNLFGVLTPFSNTSLSTFEFYSFDKISSKTDYFYMPYVNQKIFADGSYGWTNYNTSQCSQTRVCQWSANFPVFSTLDEGLAWAQGSQSERVNNTYNVNYYLSQKFNQSVDNSVTITNEMLTQNYQEINNNYYNNVYNYVSNYVTENDSNPDTSALQTKIDEMQSSLDELLEEIKNSSGGGSSEGGESSGDSSKDYSKDLEEINTSLSDIYKKLEEFYNKYKDTVDSQTEVDLSNIEKSLSDLDKLLTDFSADNLQALEDMYKRLDDILTELKNQPDQKDYSTNFENLEQILVDIQLLLSSDSELYHSSLFHIEELLDENNKQNKKFFDKVLDKLDEIIKYLKKIYRVNVVDTIADIVTAISETLEDVANVNNISVRSKETVNLMKKKFPFCMPFDLYTTLFALYAPPEVPHFEIPFVFDFLGTHTENSIEIDFEQFEGLVSFSRDLTTILFVLSLIMLTMKFFKGDDDK